MTNESEDFVSEFVRVEGGIHLVNMRVNEDGSIERCYGANSFIEKKPLGTQLRDIISRLKLNR